MNEIKLEFSYNGRLHDVVMTDLRDRDEDNQYWIPLVNILGQTAFIEEMFTLIRRQTGWGIDI